MSETFPSKSNLEARLGAVPDHAEMQTPEMAEQDPVVDRAEALLERGDRFMKDNDALFEGMMQGERQIDGLVSQGKGVLSQLNYGSIAKEQAASQLRETLAQVRQLSEHQAEAVEGHLRRDVIDFVTEAADAVQAVSRASQEQEISDRVVFIVRQTESAAEEIRGSVKLMEFGQEERDAALRRLNQLADELEHDTWGAETTAAQIGRLLEDIEDATGYHIRGLGRIEAECDTLRRLQAAE